MSLWLCLSKFYHNVFLSGYGLRSNSCYNHGIHYFSLEYFRFVLGRAGQQQHGVGRVNAEEAAADLVPGTHCRGHGRILGPLQDYTVILRAGVQYDVTVNLYNEKYMMSLSTCRTQNTVLLSACRMLNMSWDHFQPVEFNVKKLKYEHVFIQSFMSQNIWHRLRKSGLLRDKFRRTWSDAAQDARRLIWTYDICRLQASTETSFLPPCAGLTINAITSA